MNKVLLALCLLVASFAAQAQVYNQWPAQQSALNSFIAPATPAVTAVKTTAGVMTHLSCFNILATPVYVKIFDATSVTLGTTSATYQFMCPGNTAGAGFVVPFPFSISFTNAIRVAVTGGISLTDNTAITANSVVMDIGFN